MVLRLEHCCCLHTVICYITTRFWGPDFDVGCRPNIGLGEKGGGTEIAGFVRMVSPSMTVRQRKISLKTTESVVYTVKT